MNVRISKADRSVRGTIQLPPSKSIYNRVRIIRALCDIPFRIFPEASANDSIVLNRLLESDSSTLNAEDGGTTYRFMTAYLAQKPGSWMLTGNERMKQRPIGILVDALCQLGGDIRYEDKEGFPPLKINGKTLKGGKLKINGEVSSQFISALILIAPVIQGGLELELEGEVISDSYIQMTLSLMKEFGVKHEWKENTIKVIEQKYKFIEKDFTVEPDWSSASYWYEIAALADDANIILTGFKKDTIQGDSIIAELMKEFGIETSLTSEGIRLHKVQTKLPEIFSYNFKACPDLVQTIAVTCTALNITAEFKGLQSLKIKETDRLDALKRELEKIGTEVEINGSVFTINPSVIVDNSSISFETYNDHRMALSFAPLALKLSEVEIRKPEVVKKSYPKFLDDLETVGFTIQKS
jgi:3-phosphoshikimate 1-carboxyvinyltransferase